MKKSFYVLYFPTPLLTTTYKLSLQLPHLRRDNIGFPKSLVKRGSDVFKFLAFQKLEQNNSKNNTQDPRENTLKQNPEKSIYIKDIVKNIQKLIRRKTD